MLKLYHKFMLWYYTRKLKKYITLIRNTFEPGNPYNLQSLDIYSDEQIIQSIKINKVLSDNMWKVDFLEGGQFNESGFYILNQNNPKDIVEGPFDNETKVYDWILTKY